MPQRLMIIELQLCMCNNKWGQVKRSIQFMRNILARIHHNEIKRFAGRLKQAWSQPDKQFALSMASLFINDYEKRFPEAVKCLEGGLEDSLQFYEFSEIDKLTISSTNVVERIIRMIRHRIRVIKVFLKRESYISLMTDYLIDNSEGWINERSYVKQKKLIIALDGGSVKFFE